MRVEWVPCTRMWGKGRRACARPEAAGRVDHRGAQAPRGFRRTGCQGRHHHHGLDQAHQKAYQGHREGHAGLHLVHLHTDRYARELAPGDASLSGGAAAGAAVVGFYVWVLVRVTISYVFLIGVLGCCHRALRGRQTGLGFVYGGDCCRRGSRPTGGAHFVRGRCVSAMINTGRMQTINLI